MDRRDDARPDIDQARSVSRRLRRIFEPGGAALGTLEETQRLCETARVAVDDLYCKDVMRAVSACAEYAYRTGCDDVSLRPLIQSLLAAFDLRLQEHALGGGSADRSRDRRRAQRRNYVLRPAKGPLWRPDLRNPRR